MQDIGKNENCAIAKCDNESEDLVSSNVVLPPAYGRGNIIDHIRSSVRSETARRNQNHNFDNQSVHSNESPKSYDAKTLKRRMPVTFTASENVIESLDAEGDDLDDMDSVHSTGSVNSSVVGLESLNSKSFFSTMTSQLSSNPTDTAAIETEESLAALEKHGTIDEGDINCDGGLRTMDKNSPHFTAFRKERNRIHAKLTRERKKLFTARMQQMIAALERQNGIYRFQLIRQNNRMLGVNSFDNQDNITASSSSSFSSSSFTSTSSSSLSPSIGFFPVFKNHY